MLGNVIYIFLTMDTKLIGKTCFYILSEISLNMSLPVYPIELKHFKTQSGSWE